MDYRDNRPPTRKGGPYCTPIWGPGSTPIYRVPAAARLGRFYCEAYLRLKLTGRADNLRLDLGLSQDQIADVLGLSSVHINRSLRKLREKKLISRERHVYIIHDWDRLVDECQFDATYLSLMKQPR